MFVCYRTKPLSAMGKSHALQPLICSAVKVQQARQGAGVAHCTA